MKAFPLSSPRDLSRPADNKVNPLERGMDLRDYFAARAMQALLPTYPNHLVNTSVELIANDAYTMADFMMTARTDELNRRVEKPEEEAPKPAKKVAKKND